MHYFFETVLYSTVKTRRARFGENDQYASSGVCYSSSICCVKARVNLNYIVRIPPVTHFDALWTITIACPKGIPFNKIKIKSPIKFTALHDSVMKKSC